MDEILTELSVKLRNKLLTFKDIILYKIEKESNVTVHITTLVFIKTIQSELYFYFERLSSHIKRTVIECISKDINK